MAFNMLIFFKRAETYFTHAISNILTTSVLHSHVSLWLLEELSLLGWVLNSESFSGYHDNKFIFLTRCIIVFFSNVNSQAFLAVFF